MQPGGSNYDIAVLHTSLMAHDIHLFPLTPKDLEARLVDPFGIHTTAEGVLQSIAYLLRLPSHGGHWISLLSSGTNLEFPLLCDSLYSKPVDMIPEKIEQLLQASAIDAAHCSIDAFTAGWGCFLAAVSSWPAFECHYFTCKQHLTSSVYCYTMQYIRVLYELQHLLAYVLHAYTLCIPLNSFRTMKLRGVGMITFLLHCRRAE